MKKKYISLFLALVMIVGLAVPGTVATEISLYDDLMATGHVVEFESVYASATAEAKNAMTTQQVTGVYNFLNSLYIDPSASALLAKRADLNTQILSLPNAPELCTECGTLGGHTGGCALMSTPEPTVTPEPTAEPTATPDVEATPEPDVTPEPTEEPVLSVYEQIMAGVTTEEMLITMNGLIETELDAVMALTFEEIDNIAQQAKALDPELSSQDTVDLLDTLTYLPNSMASVGCPDCGQLEVHTEDCPRVNAAMMPADGVIGNYTVGSDTGNITWNLERDINLNGTIQINNGYTLTINGNNKTMKRNNSTGNLFVVKEGGTLIVNNTVIDGNKTSRNAAAFALANGTNGKSATLNLNQVTVQNCYRSSGFGAGFQFGDAEYTVVVDVTLTDCIIYNCDGVEGSAMTFRDKCEGNILLDNVEIKNCDANGTYAGTIRTQGNANCKLTIKSCNIHNNNSSNNGGGVYWNARGSSANLTITGTPEKPTIITSNTAKNGGGVFLSGSSITIENTQIIGNTATNGGGGINMQPYDYYGSDSGKGCTLTVGANAIIQNNTAGLYGGGIYMEIDGGSTSQGEDFIINIGSNAIIDNNHAKYGGGIAVTQKTGNAEYSGGSSRKYDAFLNVASGTISNNDASVDGGAFYISREYGNVGTDFKLEVNISGGTITGNEAIGNGGALYLVDTGNNAKVTVSGGTVSDNTAGTNGGGICVSSGKVNMTGGTLINNEATANGGGIYVSGSGGITMSNGTISTNKAVNGAGAYANGGSIEITGGTIISNEATSNGGGVYVSGTGGVKMSNNGTISTNKAVNGGGAFVNGGSMEMKGGTVTLNQASVNGGGAAVEGGSFTIISGTMTYNTAGSLGGGAYAKGGNIIVGVNGCTGPVHGTNHSVTHTSLPHPFVDYNDAEFAGGGFAVESVSGNSCNVYLYCGTIQENSSLNDGTGMNVFMRGDGDTCVIHHYLDSTLIGASTNHGIVITGGKLDVVTGEDKVNITIYYHSNYGEGEIWKGEAPLDYYLNLPYAPSEWEYEQNQQDPALTFLGWGYISDSTPVTGDLSYIRDKSHYKFLGDPIKVRDADPVKIDSSTDAHYIDFYAVWAPMTNNISYAAEYDNYGTATDVTGVLTVDTSYATTYSFSTMAATAPLVIPNPSKPGYTFMGWKLHADTNSISNWDSDAPNYSKYYVNDGQGQDNAGNNWSYADDKLTINMDRNFGEITLTALFVEDAVTYTYIALGPEGKAYGELNPSLSGNLLKYEETIGAATGTATGVEAIANYGYKFDGWYLDEACENAAGNAIVSGNTLTPNKNGDGIYESGEFYALFSFHLADLHITKSATGSYANEQRYIFNVYEIDPNATAEKLLTTVTIANGGNAIINDLNIGTEYKVVEVTDWSWRHDADEVSKTIEIQPDADDEGINTVEFKNTQNENRGKWLTDDSYVLNVKT